MDPHAALLARLAPCRDQPRETYSDLLGVDDLNVFARDLLQLLADRTDTSLLPHTNFSARFTLYGDFDVADWTIVYSDAGVEITADPRDDADVWMRWEAWEDLVRVINGDTLPVALLFARRYQDVRSADTLSSDMFAAIDLGVGHGRDCGTLLLKLQRAGKAGKRELEAYVREVGIDAIVDAYTRSLAMTMFEWGAAPAMGTTKLRCHATGSTSATEVRFANADRPSFSAVSTSEPETNTASMAAPSDVWVDIGRAERDLADAIADGSVKFSGDPDALQALWGALVMLLPS